MAIGPVHIAIGAAAAYLLWPKKVAAGAPPSGGAGVLRPSAEPRGPLEIDWSASPFQVAPSAPAGAAPAPAEELGWTAQQGVAPWSLERQGAPGAFLGCLGCYGTAGEDPRPSQYTALAAQIETAKDEIDSAWADYSALWLNRIGSAIGLTPAMASVRDMVASSDALAASLLDLARELQSYPDATYAAGGRKDKVFESVGAKFVGNASSIVAQIGADNFSAAMRDFIVHFPASVREVLSYTVDTAGNVVKRASWNLAQTALILGGGAALVLWLLKRSGARIDAGPIRIG